MRRPALILVTLMAITLAGCGGGAGSPFASSDTSGASSSSAATTNTPAQTTTAATTTASTTNPVTTPAGDTCREATTQMIESLDVLLDRIDADPEGMLEEVEASSTIEDLFYDLGRLVGVECGLSRGGAAFSEVLVYLADQATVRSPVTVAAINGILSGACGVELPVDLTPQGRVACAGAG